HDLLLEEDADADAARGAQEAVLLADDAAAEIRQLHRHDRAGVGCREGDARLAVAAVGEDGGEQALAGDQALARADQLVEQAAARGGRAAVAEYRLHAYGGVLVHHRAGLGDRAFARVEFHFDELHVLADDAEVDLVVALVHLPFSPGGR